MPQILENIDKICRDKGRDVLYLEFDKKIFSDPDINKWTVRNELIDWFKKHNIKASPCGSMAQQGNMIILQEVYRGWLYIDIPFDESIPDYIKLRDHLENPDESMKIPGVNFCYLPLKVAMKYKHHDEPGYWDDF